jgi:hypothetical protein
VADPQDKASPRQCITQRCIHPMMRPPLQCITAVNRSAAIDSPMALDRTAPLEEQSANDDPHWKF